MERKFEKRKLEYVRPELVDIKGRGAAGEDVCDNGSGATDICDAGMAAGGACVQGEGGDDIIPPP